MVAVVRFLSAERHWEFYCNSTCHFSKYHGCFLHFQFPTSNNSLSHISIHNSAFLSNCMVPPPPPPGVLQLRKIILLITTLYIFLNYYLFLYKRDVCNYLLACLLSYLLTYLSSVLSSKSVAVGIFMYPYYRHDNVEKIIYEEITADEQGKVTRLEKKYSGMYL